MMVRRSWLAGAAAVAAAVVAAAVLANSAFAPKQQAPFTGSSSPTDAPKQSASPVAAKPSGGASSSFFLLLVRPGSAGEGGPRLEVVSQDGADRRSHDLAGLVDSPVYDGSTRVAYWRRGDAGYELALWEIREDSTRLLYETGLKVGRPVWSATKDALVFAVAEQDGSTTLVTVEATGASSRQVSVAGSSTLSPIFADERVVAGYRRAGGYDVVDAVTGRVLAAFPTSGFAAYGGGQSSADGMALTLRTNFEAPARPLYVWRADAPRDPVVVLDRGSFHDALFRPGHSAVLYADDFAIGLVDYATGRSATLMTFPRTPFGWPKPLAFDAGGEHVVIRSASGYQIFAIAQDRLQHVADARLDASGEPVIGLIPAAALP